MQETTRLHTIGDALLARRQGLGIGQGQAAEQLGLSRTTYNAYEHDQRPPSVHVLPRLADFLGVDVEGILTLYGATAVLALRPSLEGVLAAARVQPADRGWLTAAPEAETPVSSLSPTTPASVEEADKPKKHKKADKPKKHKKADKPKKHKKKR